MIKKRNWLKTIFNTIKEYWAVAKCESGNKVLYLTGNEKGEDTYLCFH